MSSLKASSKGKMVATNKTKSGGLKLRATETSAKQQSIHAYRDGNTTINKRFQVMASSDWRNSTASCVKDTKENKTTEHKAKIFGRNDPAFEIAVHNLPSFNVIDHFYDDAKDRIVHIVEKREIELPTTPVKSGKGSKAIYVCVTSPTSSEKKYISATDASVRSPLAELRVPKYRGKQTKSLDDVDGYMVLSGMRQGDRVVSSPSEFLTKNAGLRHHTIEVNRKAGEIAANDPAIVGVISDDIDNLEEMVVVESPHRRPCHVHDPQQRERFSMLMGRLASSHVPSQTRETGLMMADAHLTNSSNSREKVAANVIQSDVRTSKPMSHMVEALSPKKKASDVGPAIVNIRAKPQQIDSKSAKMSSTMKQSDRSDVAHPLWTTRPSRADSGYESAPKVQSQLQDPFTKHKAETMRLERHAKSSTATACVEKSSFKASMDSGLESPSKGKLNPQALSFFASEEDPKKQFLQRIDNVIHIPSPDQTACEFVQTTTIEPPENAENTVPATPQLRTNTSVGQTFGRSLLPFAQQLELQAQAQALMQNNNLATRVPMPDPLSSLNMTSPVGPLPMPGPLPLPNMFNTFPRMANPAYHVSFGAGPQSVPSMSQFPGPRIPPYPAHATMSPQQPPMPNHAFMGGRPPAPCRKPRNPNPVRQQQYEAWVEYRKLVDPQYAAKCKERQNKRFQKQRQHLLGTAI